MRAGSVTSSQSNQIAAALKDVLNGSGKFWVQAQERDGVSDYEEDERFTVSYEGDDGPWFTLRAEFYIEEEE